MAGCLALWLSTGEEENVLLQSTSSCSPAGVSQSPGPELEELDSLSESTDVTSSRDSGRGKLSSIVKPKARLRSSAGDGELPLGQHTLQ